MDYNNQNENINATAEQAVVHLLDIVFDKVVFLDPATVRYNAGLVSDEGMPKADRSMRLERANYLMSHFAHIYIGLLICPEFRDAFETAVKLEISIDTMSDEQSSELRRMMKIPPKKQSRGVYVFDLSLYNDDYYKFISEKILTSFNKFSEFDDGVDMAANTLTSYDRVSIGFCISNFAYLYRAFAKNDMFMEYVRSVIKGVEERIGI